MISLQVLFFPETTYRIKIIGEGFLRNQIRIVAGTLFNLGLGKISLDDIKKSLSPENTENISYWIYRSGIRANSS